MEHQAPAVRMQRTRGTARLAIRHLDGRTRLGRLYQEGAAKIRLPQTHNGPALDAVLINTSGGLTDGDRFNWSIDIGQDARAIITTQACEKIYRALDGSARIDTRITVGSGAALSWLPQETILFDRSALTRRLEIDLAPDAGLLLIEPVIFGRQAMGESVRQAHFADRWRIRRDGRLLHAEDLRLSGDMGTLLAKNSVTGSAIAMATLLFVHKAAGDLVEPLRALLPATQCGVSAIRSSVGERLVIRAVAPGGLALRKALVPAIDHCNRILTGTGLPKIWNI
ncbi:MAG: urease accessory protein UreD [Alphaproteobacteria bacterium]|nr:urease accessory protein UreD [Alphaproteobacteria bacterium]